MFVYFCNPSNKYSYNPTVFKAYTQLTSDSFTSLKSGYGPE